MNRPAKVTVILVFLAAVLVFVGWRQAWFSGEPAWRGRTVTEWLDRLALCEDRANAAGTQKMLRDPEKVARDPALEALRHFGPRATPLLVKRLQEPAQWDPAQNRISRARLWARWLWSGIRHASLAEPPWPAAWSEFQQNRKNAAGFALLALGTNAHAGFPCFMEAYAYAPKHQSVSGKSFEGPPVGAFPSLIARVANQSLPERRTEIAEGITQGLQHTNPWCRIVALKCVDGFSDQLGRWKSQILQLTADSDPLVQETALGILIDFVQQERTWAVMPPDQVATAAKNVINNPATSPRVKAVAKALLKCAEKSAASTEQRLDDAVVAPAPPQP